MLIFKNGYLTKVGAQDDVELTPGIVISSSDTISTEASSGDYNVPSNCVGYVMVTINGVNYKMPYFNE